MWGELPSAVPEVRVRTTVPLDTVSLRVYAISEAEVTLFIEEEDVGVTEEKAGAVLSTVTVRDVEVA